MICPDCGAPVSGNMLACEACLDRRSLKEAAFRSASLADIGRFKSLKLFDELVAKVTA